MLVGIILLVHVPEKAVKVVAPYEVCLLTMFRHLLEGLSESHGGMCEAAPVHTRECTLSHLPCSLSGRRIPRSDGGSEDPKPRKIGCQVGNPESTLHFFGGHPDSSDRGD